MNERNQVHAAELAEATEHLRRSEERYHKMIEEVEEYAIILLDENGIIQNWNRGAEKIKGYRRDEIIGKHFSLFYLPEDRASGLPDTLIREAQTNGKAVHEGWRMRSDKTKFWGSITITALHGSDQKIIGYSKVTRDLTDKKMAEDQLKNSAAELQRSNEALKKSEERYHKMIAEVKDYAIILLDSQGNIQNWNAGAEHIKGYASEEIIGKNFQVFYAEEDRQRKLPQQLLSEAARSGRAIHEGWRVKKDGSTFWGSIVITAIHDEDGKIIGYSKVTRDLTEKKQADDQLKEYVKELQEQNEELDRFAYAASHDLQEPLRKVQTYADLIQQSVGDGPSVRRYVGKIITSAERMLALVKSVLEYSRVSKTVDQKVKTDLSEVLGDVLEDFDLAIADKHAVIDAGPLPSIQANPRQISQLFSNLLGNALKFSAGDPHIKVRSTTVPSDTIDNWPEHLPQGSYQQVVFSDNGIGFEPQYTEQIFSLFQRLHGRHEYEGTGVGLALCKKIMDNQGGFIRAQGHPGEGASFYLYFPTSPR